jgi:type III secretory pathway component EscR
MSKIKNHHFDDLQEVDDNGMANYQMYYDQLGKENEKQIFSTAQHKRIGTHREEGKVFLPLMVVGG